MIFFRAREADWQKTFHWIEGLCSLLEVQTLIPLKPGSVPVGKDTFLSSYRRTQNQQRENHLDWWKLSKDENGEIYIAAESRPTKFSLPIRPHPPFPPGPERIWLSWHTYRVLDNRYTRHLKILQAHRKEWFGKERVGQMRVELGRIEKRCLEQIEQIKIIQRRIQETRLI